jgi:putative hydrolase of the HAD superfamily
MSARGFRALFCDIGGVLGTNGWDAELRKRIANQFGLSLDEIEPRHHLMFDSFERGYMSFEEYLTHVFFNVPRSFTVEELRQYAYDASTPWPENINFFKQVKAANHLRFGLISNEGRGITEHRMSKFGLRDLSDFMVISHFVHLRKPDREIWHLALNLAQVRPHESIYIDDREMFVSVALGLGFTAIQHVSLETTKQALAGLGLVVD